jgi:predicted DsbA family dithiol-disulfide isomerase
VAAVRLRAIREQSEGRVTLTWRAFPLRPTPDPGASFKGTPRESGWARCRELARDTAVEYRMWTRADYPAWSMPALDAAKCVAIQGADLFEAVHLALYRAFFTDGVNIGRPEEVLEVVGGVPGVDRGRFLTDYESGRGRQAVLDDYQAALSQHGVRAIPTVVAPDGRRVIGAVSLAEYQRVLAL